MWQERRLEDQRPLYMSVADEINKIRRSGGQAGAVVGGVDIDVLKNLSAYFASCKVPLLVPGVGTQGGSLASVVETIGGADLGIHRVNVESALFFQMNIGMEQAGRPGAVERICPRDDGLKQTSDP